VLTYSGQIAPQRIDPSSAPSALLEQAQFNDQDIKDVTGLHDASLGMQSNETSGKAIMARERQGDVATFMYHDNLNAAIRECGRVINDLMPVVFDTARTVTVLGEDETSQGQRINDPTHPDSIDLGSGKYDVVVETGPSYSTKRVEAAESMMAFVQAVPAAGQAAGDLIAEAQDWPGAEAIAKRLRKMLPPGLADDEGDDQTPEQMQAKQQAMLQAQEQQAMQRKGMELEFAERAAKVQLTQAQAAKMMVEARAAATPEGQPAPYEHPLDLALKEEEVRKAKYDADKSMYDAQRASIGLHADAHDLNDKPLDTAHKAADLQAKLNPPEAEEAEA
jgi:hypothetical protein